MRIEKKRGLSVGRNSDLTQIQHISITYQNNYINLTTKPGTQ